MKPFSVDFSLTNLNARSSPGNQVENKNQLLHQYSLKNRSQNINDFCNDVSNIIKDLNLITETTPLKNLDIYKHKQISCVNKSTEIFDNDALESLGENSFDMMPKIKDRSKTLNASSTISNEDHRRSSSDKNWSFLFSVAKVFNKLSKVDAKIINDPIEIDREIEIFRQKKESSKILCRTTQIPQEEGCGSIMAEEIRNIGAYHQVIEEIKDGHPSLLIHAINFFMKDRKRNVVSNTNEYLINKPNSDGVTPLYLACVHGHLEYVKAFIKADANHLVLSKEESVIEASLRWNHLKIFEYLITLEWPKEYIMNCLRLSKSLEENPRLKALISSKLRKIRKTNSCCFS